MNRFRTKKKGKDGQDIVDRSESPAVPVLKSSKTFRLGRKHVQEPERKVELDLANALPSSDDFRTSLLMSGLSARFSMLREQDDPKSKLGKASDDSVLFPKRHSRLNDFGFVPGLSDIAEVSSIRAPFLSSRTDSYHSADTNYDEGGGSIMSRAKPGEGNNLFGGRQKIYKIPAGNGSHGMAGRALYDDDVAQSSFQRLRQKEREERREREERKQQEQQRRDQYSFDESERSNLHLRSPSPTPFGYNRNRETSSTTSSGPSVTRSSTTATSFTSNSNRSPSVNGPTSPSTPSIPGQSNGLEKPVAKAKRLYENGLDHHLHSQQHSAMSRLDTLSRQPRLGVRTPSPVPGTPLVNGSEHNHSNGAGNPRNAFRSASPPLTGETAGSFDFNVKSVPPAEAQRSMFVAPPLSPPVSDGDEKSILPIQPNDRGKATALGTFSKPVQPYDERKYTQRQLQMHQTRDTSPTRKLSSPRSFNTRPQVFGRNRAASTSTNASESTRSSASSATRAHPAAASPAMAPQQEEIGTSDMEGRLGLESTLPTLPTLAFNPPPRPSPTVAKDRSWEHVAPQKLKAQKLLQEMNENMDAKRPLESQHPANRQVAQRLWKDYTVEYPNRPTAAVPAVPGNPVDKRLSSCSEHHDPPADSPTLGPTNGLSGLVRQHLRSDSNTSSVYGVPSPSIGYPDAPPVPAIDHTYHTQGNPWEINDWDQGTAGPSDPVSSHMPTTTADDEPTSFLFADRNSVDENEAGPQNQPREEQTTHQRHSRNNSSDTQKERNEFKNELRSARRRVQKSLTKSYAESDNSRSTSPTPTANSGRTAHSARTANSGRTNSGMEGSFTKSNPISMLKSKASRDSILAKSRNGSTKAMKMLGISSSNNTDIPPSPQYPPEEITKAMKTLGITSAAEVAMSSPNKYEFDESTPATIEDAPLQGIPESPRSPPSTKTFRQARRDAQRERERQVLLRRQQQDATARSSDSSEDPVRQPVQSPPRQRLPTQGVETEEHPRRRVLSEDSESTSGSGTRPSTSDARELSSSDASGRTKARQDVYRDDFGGPGNAGQMYNGELSSRPRPTANAYSRAKAIPLMAATGQARSKSRGAAEGYPDMHEKHPVPSMHHPDMGVPRRVSPPQPFSANVTPALAPPIVYGPGMAHSPSTQGFQSQGRIPSHLKRNVHKSEISEPRLVSKTSHIITVDLPSGASLNSGMPQSAPPLPPQDPRRRNRARDVFGGLIKTKNLASDSPLPSPGYPGSGTQSPSYYEETSVFSTADDGRNPHFKQQIRKVASEGGNLNAGARQVFTSQASPAVPSFPRAVRGGGMI
jgi:hypothetical protein